MVFGSRFSIDHCWDVRANAYLAFPEENEIDTKLLRYLVDCHTNIRHLHQRIRWDLHGHA